MVIDCRSCAMRDIACSDCVVSSILGLPEVEITAGLDLPDAERHALRVLEGAGLVPPLRLVTDGEALAG